MWFYWLFLKLVLLLAESQLNHIFIESKDNYYFIPYSENKTGIQWQIHVPKYIETANLRWLDVSIYLGRLHLKKIKNQVSSGKQPTNMEWYFYLTACLKNKITRLVYTSTYNVIFGGQEIRDGDDSLPYLPLDQVT